MKTETITVTAENLETVRESLPESLKDKVVPGCRTWCFKSDRDVRDQKDVDYTERSGTILLFQDKSVLMDIKKKEVYYYSDVWAGDYDGDRPDGSLGVITAEYCDDVMDAEGNIRK